MRTFCESLTGEGFRNFKKLALALVGPEWRPIYTQKPMRKVELQAKLESQEEIAQLMTKVPNKKEAESEG